LPSRYPRNLSPQRQHFLLCQFTASQQVGYTLFESCYLAFVFDAWVIGL
jgi:hypothetical protein